MFKLFIFIYLLIFFLHLIIIYLSLSRNIIYLLNQSLLFSLYHFTYLFQSISIYPSTYSDLSLYTFPSILNNLNTIRSVLSSSQLMTILGGFIGSFLHVFLLTALGNLGEIRRERVSERERFLCNQNFQLRNSYDSYFLGRIISGRNIYYNYLLYFLSYSV